MASHIHALTHKKKWPYKEIVSLQLRKAPSIHAQLYHYWEKGCFITKKKKKNYPITLFESLSREGTFRSSYILISYQGKENYTKHIAVEFTVSLKKKWLILFQVIFFALVLGFLGGGCLFWVWLVYFNTMI